ncbi:MAG: hypothetical protein ABSE16_18870 [Verrucomicrobiota bacterium]|jgi:hypothetical protein
MKKMKLTVALMLGTLFAFWDRLTAPRGSVALANALGLFGAKAETLYLDPNSTYNSGNPWPGRNLLVQRGASGYQYGDLSAGTNRPLGMTLDAPFNSSDPFEVQILGAHPGLFLGVGVAAQAVTIDHLVVAAAGGRIQDITTLGNGTYWVVGKATATIAANADLGEVPYVPCLPYQVTVSNGGGTYAYTAPTGS